MILHWWMDLDSEPAPDRDETVVAYSGESGGAAYEAAVRHAEAHLRRGSVSLRSYACEEEVADAVRTGSAQYGVLHLNGHAVDLSGTVHGWPGLAAVSEQVVEPGTHEVRMAIVIREIEAPGPS